MGIFKDLTGQQIGRLAVIKLAPKRDWIKGRVTYWWCTCDCGKMSKSIRASELVKNRIQSCGCLCFETRSKRMKEHNIGTSRIHGLSTHPLRAIRKAMLHRCYNENNKYYRCYGGRGIKVCDEWRNDLITFYDWSIENGWKKGLSIDRIGNDGMYCPENCKWITVSENSSKSRTMSKGRIKEGIKAFCEKNHVQHGVARILFDQYTKEQIARYVSLDRQGRREFWSKDVKNSNSAV